MRSIFGPSCGTQRLWITSADVSEMLTRCPAGMWISFAVTAPFGYLISHHQSCPMTVISKPGCARASVAERAREKTKNPIKIAPLTPSPAIKMKRSPHGTSRWMSSSRIRRPPTTPYAPIMTTKTVTTVATHTIGHQMLLAVRSAGPFANVKANCAQPWKIGFWLA